LSGARMQFRANSREQLLSVERLFKEKAPPALGFVIRTRKFVTTCNQNNRQGRPDLSYDLLKREPVVPRHTDVRYDAVDVAGSRIKELLCGIEHSNHIACRLQQILKRFEDPVVIVNQRHYRFLRRRHDYYLFLLLRDHTSSNHALAYDAGPDIFNLSAMRTKSAMEWADIFRMILLR
jgi:hypothetical protein